MSENSSPPDPSEFLDDDLEEESGADQTQTDTDEKPERPRAESPEGEPPGNKEPEGEHPSIETLTGTPSDARTYNRGGGRALTLIGYGIGLVCAGLIMLQTGRGFVLERTMILWGVSVLEVLAIAGIGAGIYFLYAGVKVRMYTEIRAATEEAWFGLLGLDPRQRRQIRENQRLIEALLEDLPKQQAHLEALLETPTQNEQVRQIAESQRELWEEIEGDFE